MDTSCPTSLQPQASLDEGSSAALHSPVALGTCSSSPLPLIPHHAPSWSMVRWTGMGREHLTPWKGHVWKITKADPWGNQTHGRERSGAFGFPISLPGCPQNLRPPFMEKSPQGWHSSTCITRRCSSWVSLACRTTVWPNFRVCSMQLIPTRNLSGALREELWICPAQGNISLLHGSQGSVMLCIC